ncbi:hypothetical protein BVRB_9g220320 [Beta vulgaris subsp. vulgaris]|nr:hypothetical protein BVRB_9g220320 [Beta vulgaris subsp. vulgaris]
MDLYAMQHGLYITSSTSIGSFALGKSYRHFDALF